MIIQIQTALISTFFFILLTDVRAKLGLSAPELAFIIDYSERIVVLVGDDSSPIADS